MAWQLQATKPAKQNQMHKVRKVPFIPMSGLQGENLDRVSEKMPWYKGFKGEIVKLSENKLSRSFTLNYGSMYIKNMDNSTKKTMLFLLQKMRVTL